MLSHFLDQFDFSQTGRLLFFQELVEQRIEHLLVFGFENFEGGGEAVPARIARDLFATAVAERTGAFLRIPAVRLNFFETCHLSVNSSVWVVGRLLTRAVLYDVSFRF